MIARTLAVAGLVAIFAAVPGAQPERQSSIFAINSDDFWLNLHHFLYVLGRAVGHSRCVACTRRRRAARGRCAVAGLTEAEKQEWQAAVAKYAAALSRKDAISAGSYSTTGSLIVMSSRDGSTKGLCRLCRATDRAGAHTVRRRPRYLAATLVGIAAARARLKSAFEEVWKPHLDGRMSKRCSLAALLESIGNR